MPYGAKEPTFLEAFKMSSWRDRFIGTAIILGAMLIFLAVIAVGIIKVAAYWRIAFG